MEMSRLTRGAGLQNPSRETKFSGANADREILIFPVQLTTSRIGNNTRLIHTLAMYVTIHIHTNIHLFLFFFVFVFFGFIEGRGPWSVQSFLDMRAPQQRHTVTQQVPSVSGFFFFFLDAAFFEYFISLPFPLCMESTLL